MNFLSSQKALFGLGLAGLLLAPHSAHAFGYMPPAPDLTVTSGTATDDGTSTAVTGDYKFANGTSTSTTKFNAVEADSTASLLFTGGGAQNVTTRDSSTATLAGGTFSNIGAYGNSTVTISGGTFSDLYTFDNATINLIGTNLTAAYYPPSSPIGIGFEFPSYYKLNGTLSDGTAVTGYYESGESTGGRLQFNGVPVASPAPVPETSSVVSLGLMLAFGAGGAVLARKKKAQTAA